MQKVEISIFEVRAASHLPRFPAQASHPGNLYHQPIASPIVFSRRDSTVSEACYQVESRVEASPKLLDRFSFKPYTFFARAYLQCHGRGLLPLNKLFSAMLTATSSEQADASNLSNLNHRCTRSRQRKRSHSSQHFRQAT